MVLDLETTGTDPEHDAITEIGAVRVVGGNVVEEFQTFVNPERDIPAYIARLTGITNYMVKDAPTAAAVIPSFLEFARSSVLVAHNARFDIGFLKAATLRHGYAWPKHDVVDTLTLARRVFTRDEVPNHKLGTLAQAVRATTVPNHRALSDARATVDVLHEILVRLEPSGAKHLRDITHTGAQPTSAQTRKRHLANDIPARAGVYSFVAEDGEVLYVGKSANLRSRVRTYFSAQEKRKAVLNIIPLTDRIEILECSSDTEASIRELRIIAEHKPVANRQGVRPSQGNWLRVGPGSEGVRLARKVTEEADGCLFLGPLRSRHDVEPLRTLIYSVLGTPYGEDSERDEALTFHDRVRRCVAEDPSEFFRAVSARMRALAERGQYEQAESLRSRTQLLLAAAERAAMLRALASAPFIVAAQRIPVAPEGIVEVPRSVRPSAWSWEVLAIRHGRFGAARTLAPWEDPLAVVEKLREESAHEAESAQPLCFGYHHEAELLTRWLQHDSTRIVHCEGEWSMPARAHLTMQALLNVYSATPA